MCSAGLMLIGQALEPEIRLLQSHMPLKYAGSERLLVGLPRHLLQPVSSSGDSNNSPIQPPYSTAYKVQSQ